MTYYDFFVSVSYTRQQMATYFGGDQKFFLYGHTFYKTEERLNSGFSLPALFIRFDRAEIQGNRENTEMIAVYNLYFKTKYDGLSAGIDADGATLENAVGSLFTCFEDNTLGGLVNYADILSVSVEDDGGGDAYTQTTTIELACSLKPKPE